MRKQTPSTCSGVNASRWLLYSSVPLLLAAHAFAGPVAHYTFNDSDDRYKNTVSSSYQGTVDGSGTTFSSSGVSGLGDAMNTTTGSRVLVNETMSVGLDSFAISFWCTASTSGAWDNWLSFGGTDALFLQSYDNQAHIFLDNPGGIAGYSSYGLSIDLEGGLNHIVVSASSAEETAAIFCNGVLTDTSSWTVASNVIMGYLTIGGARSTTERNIAATIDDVQIYDITLTSGDVSYLYDNPGDVVPEPATLSLLALGGIMALLRRRRETL